VRGFVLFLLLLTATNVFASKPKGYEIIIQDDGYLYMGTGSSRSDLSQKNTRYAMIYYLELQSKSIVLLHTAADCSTPGSLFVMSDGSDKLIHKPSKTNTPGFAVWKWICLSKRLM